MAEKNVVVVGVDGGHASVEAFMRAVKLFDLTKTSFHFVHVRPAEDTLVLSAISEGMERYQTRLEKAREEQSQAILGKFIDLATGADVTDHTEVQLKGDPRSNLCEYCTKVKAEALVLGTRSVSSVEKIFLGSVALHCMLNAPCSVVINKVI